MSWVLQKDGAQVAVSGGWNPNLFGTLTATSFPSSVTSEFAWEHDGYSLGWVADPDPAPPTLDQIAEVMTSAVQEHLDSVAQGRGYDDIVSACSYAGAANPFQAESQSFIQWRGNVWVACYQIMVDVESGARAVPTINQLLAELPQMQ